MTESQDRQDPITEMLDTLKETPERDPQRAARSRQQFLSRAKELSAQPVSISWFQRLINVFRTPQPQMRFSTLTIGLIAGLLLIAFSGSAAAAQQALPDHFLYPYKIWLENQRLALTTDPAGQLDLRLDYAEERLDELNTVDQPLSDDDLAGLLSNFEDHLHAAEGLIEQSQGDEAQLERLRELLEYGQPEQEFEAEEPEEEEDEDEPTATSTPEPTGEPEETPTPDQTDDPDETEEPEGTDHPNRTEDPEETDTPDDPSQTEDPDETQDPDETEDPDEDEESEETPTP